MEVKIVKNPITNKELQEIAKNGFGCMVKAVVDVEKEIMAVGGELHSDEQVSLVEEENSRFENTWGINIYPEKSGEDWIEFDSMVNIKPSSGNRSLGIESEAIKRKIVKIAKKLII